MLKFENIELNDSNIKSIGDVEAPIPKSFLLIFSDEELKKELIPKLEKTLDEHDFEREEEHILFQVYYDQQWNKYKILMDIAYFYLESEGDSNIPDMDTVEKTYRPIFEDFYKKNKPY